MTHNLSLLPRAIRFFNKFSFKRKLWTRTIGYIFSVILCYRVPTRTGLEFHDLTHALSSVKSNAFWFKTEATHSFAWNQTAEIKSTPVLLKYFGKNILAGYCYLWLWDDPWCPSSSTDGSSWPRGMRMEQISLAGQKQTLVGHHRGPYFPLAGQINKFTIN